MSRGAREPLYRKVNTRTHGVDHGSWMRAAYERNTKRAARDARMTGSMHSGQRHGFDYTPLFRFLLSRVGRPWDAVHSEAVRRLDREEPVWWLVAACPVDERDVVRGGEAQFFSGLRIGADGRLEKVAPEITEHDLNPPCDCCTHTFNGKRLTRPYRHGAPLMDADAP